MVVVSYAIAAKKPLVGGSPTSETSGTLIDATRPSGLEVAVLSTLARASLLLANQNAVRSGDVPVSRAGPLVPLEAGAQRRRRSERGLVTSEAE